MAYKVAGIDVHKKVLMVVVMKCEPGAEQEHGAAALRNHDPANCKSWRRGCGSGSARSGDGIDGAILEAGVVRVGGEDPALHLAQAYSNRARRGRKHDFAMPSAWCGGWWRAS